MRDQLQIGRRRTQEERKSNTKTNAATNRERKTSRGEAQGLKIELGPFLRLFLAAKTTLSLLVRRVVYLPDTNETCFKFHQLISNNISPTDIK